MSEVHLDLIDDDRFTIGSAGSFDKVHLSERDDAIAVKKTMEIEVPHQASNSMHSLAGRVSLSDSEAVEVCLEDEEAVKKGVEAWLRQLDPEEFDLIEQTMIKNPDREENFMVRLPKVIAMIMASLHESSEKSKSEIHKLEAGIKKSTLSAAELQRGLGWNSLYSAGFVMATSLLQFLPGANDLDKQVFKVFTDNVAPSLGNIRRYGLEADLSKSNNNLSLLNNKYNMQSTLRQSESGRQQEVTQLLEKGYRLNESAARSGG